MSLLLSLLIAAGAVPEPAAPSLRSATCIGPADAKAFAVYLHSVDAATVSAQELGNRENLARVAEALSIRIALPRAPRACPNHPSSRGLEASPGAVS
jgi:hypothetical protein